MDQHLHSQQWHPRPIQATVCRICAMPHFPFCPPHPSFNQNPRYQFGPDPSFQRPDFDPYRLSMGMPRPFMGNPNDGFADQRPWSRNPGNSYEHVPFQSYRESFVPPPFDYGSNGFAIDAERSNKRPRVDDVGSESVLHERRLKLVRDHGGASTGPSEGGCETEEKSVVEGSFSRPGSENLDGRDPYGHEESNLASGKQLQNSKDCFRSDLDHPVPSQNEEFSHSRHAQHMPPPVPDLTHRKESHYSDADNRQAFSWMDHRNHNNLHVLDRDYRPSPRSEVDPIHTRQFSSHGQRNFERNAPHGTRNFNFSPGYGGGRFLEHASPIEDSRLFSERPPLPTSPPPPLPWDAHLHTSAEPRAYSSPAISSSLFPVNTSALPSSTYNPVPEIINPYHHHNTPIPLVYSGSITEALHPSSYKRIVTDGQSFGLKQLSPHKPKVIDASHLFKLPYRSTRPDHIVVILRGLPGSGKSYLAKMLRDVEVENGGDAPRIHSMDDYFMTEVEKVDEGDSNSSNSIKGKKPIVKQVMEYCYEPEMEEAYRSSMLKAFKKTLEEGVFTFVIVDDRNLRVADFAQFWAIAKSSGYEVYILEATYKDPAGCAARNVHGFTLDDIQKMAGQWEEAPPLYLQLDIKSLCHGDDLKESGIQEVDMDMEDGDGDSLSSLQEMKTEKADPSKVYAAEDDGKRGDAEPDHQEEEVKELGRSKWSSYLDEDDSVRTEKLKGNANALSGLLQAYAREGKSVRWIDQVGNTGFSIGAAKKSNKLSLVIGPGAGYNLKSNPLPEEDYLGSTHGSSESKKHSIFEDRLRAESESFKVVFDKRRQRIGLDWEEE